MDEVCALGHRRLSIIDLATGDQPMYNDDKSVVVVFNGEIYNFKELKKGLEKKYKFKTTSDTEVLVHGYEEWGHELTKKLRGMFAFAIWDVNKKELYCARDGWGIKPFYYYENNGTFMFASEIKAFLDHPDFEKEFNGDILSAYLCFNSTPTTETFFKGVKRLEPGYELVYKDGNITFQDEHGIQPLLIQIKKKGLKNAIAVDKVIGKAAALLMVYGKVKQVHTNIIAKDAIPVFEKYKVEYSYNEVVDYIQNNKKDGLCPMEQKVLNVDSPKKAYKIFAKKK